MSVIEISKQAFSGNHRAQASGKGKRTEDDYIQDERINKLIINNNKSTVALNIIKFND